MVWNKKRVTTTGTVIVGACEFGGVICQVAGTSTTVTVYDATSVVAESVVVASTSLASANAVAAPGVSGGVQMSNGIHVVIGGSGSPAVWVLYR